MRLSPTTQRLQWLLWALLAWAGIIFGRLVWLQVIRHDELLRLAEQQQQKIEEVQALRGSILDRTGQPLAKTLPADSVAVDPQKIPDLKVAADVLSRTLQISDRALLYQRLKSYQARGSHFMWVARKLDAKPAERLRSKKLPYVEFRSELRRFYPHHELASHVVGSIGYVDGSDAERGSGGIESSFEEDLAGRPGLARVLTDVHQTPYESTVTRAPEAGADLTLSIDPNLQYEAERQLDKAIASSHARTGSIVAINPYTGDILAMANYPRYDPNLPPGSDSDSAARSNLAISTPFEPGSVFKVVTLSAAFETTNLTPDTLINCGNGSFKLYGRVIHDTHSYSILSAADVLAKSSNIGAIQIALKTGERPLYKYQRLFGFGQKTGIELAGESSGNLRDVKDWMATSIGSLAMGHEVSVTSLQLAVAGAVVANGGLKVKPRLVIARQKPGQPLQRIPIEPPVRILRPETAITMRQLMEGVVLRGTGRGLASLKGYTSGGKTGSAQIYDVKAHVYTHNYNASFLGFAPVANPQIVIAVTLNHTTGGSAGYGGPVAAPVFREVAMDALRMLDVPKDLPESDTKLARKSDSSKDASNDLSGDLSKKAGLFAPPGQRPVSSVTPPPVREDASASAETSSPDRRPFLTASTGMSGGSRTPDFSGKSLRSVLEESAAAGFPVEVHGSGLARSQDPPPGTPIRPHALVRVQLGR
ncbi:MAG TPA: penicillin-binding protein [Bryobacteraceae bacterium]|jgi:cell division protein FtsI (penicillin-binding protein 3)|nr:penicillin-binding protein [Bryobacteraceae bacterium]